VEEAESRGITTVDPATGVPVKDLLLDPNVAGVGEEAEDLMGDDGPKGVQSRRGPDGVQILVDMTQEGWEDEVAAAFKAAKEEFGFEHDPDKPTEVITRG
jgi:hypothetical protein